MDIQEVSRLIENLEGDRKGVPVLLRQYLKLGGRLLAFSEDHAFGDVIDGLMVCDLRTSDPKVLAKYMGEEGARCFSEYHALQPLNAALCSRPSGLASELSM